MAVVLIPEKKGLGFGLIGAAFTIILAFLIVSPIYIIFISAKPTVSDEIAQSVADSNYLLTDFKAREQQAISFIGLPKKIYAQPLKPASAGRVNPFLSF